jgi:hypothetical protein
MIELALLAEIARCFHSEKKNAWIRSEIFLEGSRRRYGIAECFSFQKV